MDASKCGTYVYAPHFRLGSGAAVPVKYSRFYLILACEYNGPSRYELTIMAPLAQMMGLELLAFRRHNGLINDHHLVFGKTTVVFGYHTPDGSALTIRENLPIQTNVYRYANGKV